jgi:hypothetical protein
MGRNGSRARQRRFTRGWHGTVALATLASLLGCASERDPRQSLTADEGAELLREIRTDRTRLSELTPAEREYLLRTLKR